MRSEIHSEGRREPKPFPKLMKSSVTGRVVLFHKSSCGISVYLPDKVTPGGTTLGGYSEIWTMNDFFDFDGSITLWA